MRGYISIVSDVLTTGVRTEDRTGVGTLSKFGMTYRHHLSRGFPATTTKRLAFKTMAAELACFLKGYTDIREFHKRNCHIWDANMAKHLELHPNADPHDMGPIYGAQWTDFNGLNQMREVINELKVNPTSRRLLVTAWNPPQHGSMILPPCHYAWQLRTRGKFLDLLFTMRSVDVMLGMPFDIASYALLNHLICNETGLLPGELIGHFGDTHIYFNHISAALDVIRREPYELPDLDLTCSPGMPVENFEPEMVDLFGYSHHPAVKLELAT